MGICLVMGLLCHGMVPSSIFRVCWFRLSGLGARGFVMALVEVWLCHWSGHKGNSLVSRALSACGSWSGTCALGLIRLPSLITN